MKEELTISLNCVNVESLIRSLTKFDTFLEFYIQENFSRREVYIVKYFIKTYKQNSVGIITEKKSKLLTLTEKPLLGIE